jgi:hypothetical protein
MFLSRKERLFATNSMECPKDSPGTEQHLEFSILQENWWHADGADVDHVPEYATSLPGSAIRAYVHRAPTVFA